MANMFALILVIATLVTGILWCVDKFFFAPKRRERQAAAQAAAGDSLDKATLKKVAPKPGWLETGASVFPVLAIVLIVNSFISADVTKWFTQEITMSYAHSLQTSPALRPDGAYRYRVSSRR